MLRISKKQLGQLAEDDYEGFVRDMLVHIEEHFPEHYIKLGEDNTRGLVDLGVDKAKQHSFDSERDICKYINLMLCFGVEFDEDPKQIWAQAILTDPMQNYGPEKMKKLYAAAEAHLKQKMDEESLIS